MIHELRIDHDGFGGRLEQGVAVRARHLVDTGVRFERNVELPERRAIEVADVDEVSADNPPTAWVDREPYVASSSLHHSVNLAIALGRPLLPQGDPGAYMTCRSAAPAASATTRAAMCD
jgi:hypothetical protein